jgi:hypothetical protein
MLELTRSKLTKPSLFYATDRRPTLGMTLHQIGKMIASLVDVCVAILHACDQYGVYRLSQTQHMKSPMTIGQCQCTKFDVVHCLS